MSRDQELKYNNIIPIIGIIIALVVNIGTIFWWGGRTDIQLQQVITTQRQANELWLKIETRLGEDELQIRELQVMVKK